MHARKSAALHSTRRLGIEPDATIFNVQVQDRLLFDPYPDFNHVRTGVPRDICQRLLDDPVSSCFDSLSEPVPIQILMPELNVHASLLRKTLELP